MFLKVTHNLDTTILALENLERAMSPMLVDLALDSMGRRLAKRHKTAVQYRGHGAWGGPMWDTTDEKWAARMRKGHINAMYWTGEFMDSISSTMARDGQIFIQAVDYSLFFQYPLLHPTAHGRVGLDADGFVALDKAGAVRTKTIKRKYREVFWVDESPGGDWMHFETMIAGMAGPGFDYEQF